MIRYCFHKSWQVIGAAISYFLFGLGVVLLGVLFRIISLVPGISAAKKQRWIRYWIHLGCLIFINLMRLFGLIRYTFDLDSLSLVKPGCLVVANHPSLIDVVLLFAMIKDLSCIVKAELWNNLFTGMVVRLAGFIPNNSVDAVSLSVKKLREGENLLIFPEGSRTKVDDSICFKRGASNIAVEADIHIMPVLIECYPGALKKGQKWYIIPSGGSNFSISSGQLLKLDKCIDTTKRKTLQYRELTQFLESAYKKWQVTGLPPVPKK